MVRRPVVSSFVLFFAAIVAVLLSGASFAHHSRAPFNMDALLAFAGTVVRFQWRNPHVYIMVKDADGNEWLLETDAVPVMIRSGWSRDSFSPGDAVTVRLRPDKNPAEHHGLLVSISGDDGVMMASMNRGNEEGIEIIGASATSLAGLWAGKRLEAFRMFPAFGDIPVTAAGAEAQRKSDSARNAAADCVPPTGAVFMWANWIYLTEVEFGDDAIIMRNELYGGTRTIYMDGRDHPANGERTVQGHSIGHWEDDTLLIESSLFADHPSIVPNSGIPSGEKFHLVERLTLSDDGQTAHYEFVAEDPDYLAEPLTGEYTWHYAPHLEFIMIECDPEIARRYLE